VERHAEHARDGRAQVDKLASVASRGQRILHIGEAVEHVHGALPQLCLQRLVGLSETRSRRALPREHSFLRRASFRSGLRVARSFRRGFRLFVEPLCAGKIALLLFGERAAFEQCARRLRRWRRLGLGVRAEREQGEGERVEH